MSKSDIEELVFTSDGKIVTVSENKEVKVEPIGTPKIFSISSLFGGPNAIHKKINQDKLKDANVYVKGSCVSGEEETRHLTYHPVQYYKIIE